MSVPLSKYDIYIECGADFLWSFVVGDNEGNLVDLTGSTISAQLREYANSNDSLNFTVTHNGVGGKITLTMPHEDTNTIPYSMGVYDVFLTLNGTTEKIIYGDVTVYPNVTKPVDGEIIYLLSFASEDDFPMTGMTRRVYLSHQTNKMYRWNGSAYVTVNGKTFWDDIPDKPSTFPPSAHNHDDRYYTEAEVDTALSAKEDIANLKALAYKDKADFYDDIDNLPSGYPPSPHNHDDRYYTEGEMDTALSAKADASDVYSKSDVDTALSGKSDTGHTHTMSDVTDLPTLGALAEKDTVDYDTDIDNLPTLGDLADHDTVDYDTEVTNKPTLGALAEKDTVDWDTDIDNIPNTFPPESHTHTMSDVTDLPTFGDLAEKDTVDWDTDIDDIPSTFPPSSHTHTVSDISNFPTLGSLAAKSSVDYSTSEVTNKPTLGTMAAINDAPSDGEEYVRKDGDWAIASGGGGGGSWGSITGTLSDQTDLDDALDGKVSTSGDTMTGDLIITETPNVNLKMKNTSMDYTRTTSGSAAQSIVRFLDYQENTAGAFQIYQTPEGYVQAELAAQKKYNNNTYTNKIILRVLNTGTYQVEVTAASAWRSAILVDSGWKTLTASSVYTGTIYYKSMGDFVEVTADGLVLKADRDSSGWTTLKQIPSGYRPSKKVTISFVCNNVAQRGLIVIETGGNIKISAESGVTLTTSASISFQAFYRIA